MTKRKIRGKNISMFRLIVVSYSYLIILSALLCILFYIASLFPYISIGIWCVIPNTIFIIGIFNILFATIRTISMLYFILTRSKQQKRKQMVKDINRLKVVLAEQKRTNKWLAEELGKDPASVSKWCTNASQPSLETLVEIARSLNVDVKDLLWSTKER